MNINEIATKSDVEDIMFAIEKLRSLLISKPLDKKYLRSADVRKLLKISDSTLQRLRIKNKLPARKINGTWFYNHGDVIKMIEGDED